MPLNYTSEKWYKRSCISYDKVTKRNHKSFPKARKGDFTIAYLIWTNGLSNSSS